MQQKTIIAFAVVASVLVATAMPAMAATADDLASIHTTDTDFQAADTLDDVTVEGTGTSASIEPVDASYNVIDDSGDGTADGTRGFMGDGGGNNAQEVETKIRPNFAGEIDSITYTIGSARGSDYGFTVDIYIVKENPDGTTGEGTLVKSNYDPPFSTGTETVSLDTTYYLQENTNYTIEWVTSGTDSDSTEDRLRVNVDTSFSTTWYYGSFGSNIGADITVSSNDSFAGSATYISQNHTADSIEAGFTDIETLDNASATITWEYWSGSQWVTQDQSSYSSSGNKSVTWATQSTSTWRVNVTFTANTGVSTASLADEGVLFDASAPTLNNSTASPTGGTNLTSTSVDLSIQVNDSDFATSQGDEVDVTYWTKAPSDSSFTKEGTTTITSNGTATLSTTFTEGGDWEWYAVAEDSYGDTSPNSSTFKFTVPSTLNIRNETPVHGKINNAEVDIIFYEDNESSPTIINRTVSNGEVDLSGLPVGTKFSVHIETTNHHSRTVLLNSIYDQHSIYLLQKPNITSVEQTFNVDDSTGNFPAAETELIIQRAINDSIYDANGDGFNWTNVAGDDLSAAGAFTVDLQQDTRYRLIVQNDDGDTRILGAYTPTASGTVNLRIGSVKAVPENPGQEYTYNASWTNSSGTVKVNVEYNDTTDNTSTLHVEIYNRSDSSDHLYTNTTFTDLGTLSITETVPSSDEDTTWIVKLTIERTGQDTQVVEIPVGPRRPLLQDMDGWLVAVISIGSLFVVGGLFSQVNGDVGALVLAGMGGMYYFVDMLPSGTGVGVVILAMIAAGLLFVQERRAGGL